MNSATKSSQPESRAPSSFFLSRFWEQLILPHPSILEPEQRRRVRLLSSLLLVIIVIGIATLFLHFFVNFPTVNVQIGFIGVIVLAFAYGLSRTKHADSSLALTMVTIWASVLSGSIIDGDPGILHFLICGVLAGSLFLSPKYTFIFSTASALSILILPALYPTFSLHDIANPAFNLGLTGVLATVIASIQLTDVQYIKQQSLELADNLIELDRDRAALQKSETLLKIQIESMPIAFIVLDTKFRVTAWNPAAQKTFGFTAEEALGKSPYELIVSEKVQPHTDEVWSRLLAGKTTVHSVNENLTRDGRTIVCEWSNTLLKDADGRIVAVLSMAQDITERIRTEEALRASEVRYRNLFDRIPVALYRTTPQGEILDANPALVEMLGYPDRETLLGMNVRALYAKPEERIEESSLLERDGLVRGVHLQLRHYDGHAIWARDTARSVCDPGGGVLYYEGSLEDITARKRMEEALLESEQRYHGLFEHSPVSLWEEDFSAVKRYVDRLSETGIVDFRRYFTEHPESVAECISLVQVVDVNHATLGIFQASEKDELLSGLDRVLAIDEQVMFTEELISIAEERSLLEIEGRNRTLNGEVIDVLLRWSVAPGNEDTLSKVLVSITDITRRKQAEESIRRHMARVEALAEISRALSAASLEPQVIFDIIVERTAQLIGDACLLTLISDDREWMQVISYNHRDQRSLSLMREMLTSTQKWGVEGAVGRVISTGQPLLIPVMTPDELQGIAGLEFQACLEVVRIFSLIIVPLVAQGQIIGTLWAWRDHPGDPYIDENQSFLLNLANQTALTIVNARLHELVKYQARTDSLTGIYNRRYFFELAELEFSRSKRHKHALAVIMLDLDRFKEVNDSYGHAAGDQVLRTVADRCRENIRNTDILGRYGGEEFIILLPETNFSGAKNLAERLRRCISEYPIETDAGKIHITVSLGIAINHKNILNLAMLLHNADEALYAGKHAGRNQVAFIGREQK